MVWLALRQHKLTLMKGSKFLIHLRLLYFLKCMPTLHPTDRTKQISICKKKIRFDKNSENSSERSEKTFFKSRFNRAVSYYPEYFGIIQPGHENETFWCKHLSWLDQAILFCLLIFIAISFNVLWSLKHKKSSRYFIIRSTLRRLLWFGTV